MEQSRNSAITRFLVADGFAPDTTVAWASSPLQVPAEQIAATAREWRQHGMDTPEAVAWCVAGYQPQVAGQWRLYGYSLAQARFIGERLSPRPSTSSLDQSPATQRDDPAAWRESGMSPSLVTLCIACGRLTVAAGQALVDEMAQDPFLRGSIEIGLAAYGVDLRSMQASS